VPIPDEFAARGEKVQLAVEQTVRESIEQGIDKRGKEVTPWLLKRVGELTAGTALELSTSRRGRADADVKLIENNARVGAAVALELAQLKRAHASQSVYRGVTIPEPESPSLPPPRVVVIGSAALDITSRSRQVVPRTTTPGEIELTPGGVGRNIAEAAARALPAGAVQLVSPVGAVDGAPDAAGTLIRAEMAAVGMRTDGLIMKAGERSSACTLILGADGDLEAGVADMGIVERLGPDDVRGISGEMIVFDCNPTTEVLTAILQTAYENNTPSTS
jgi:pseudouridine-5'-phosphate glycosidase/pseudouridine kinase